MISDPPRGPRGAPRAGGRVARAGGIQKRRVGGPARVDKDGDLVMGAATVDEKSKAGKGRIGGSSTPLAPGRRNNGPSRGSEAGIRRARHGLERGIAGGQGNILATLQVTGLKSSKAASTNKDGGMSALVEFLSRKATHKANRKVEIKKSYAKGESVFITATVEDVAELLKLDGFTFAGANLSIMARDSPGGPAVKKELSPETVSVKERFKSILMARYSVENKVLNLSALASDAGLQEMGLFDGTTNTSKVFPALMAICEDLFKDRNQKQDMITGVILANNNITNVSEVIALAHTFPDLRNIDLSGNQLASLKSFDAWRRELPFLETLILTGNPVETSEPGLKDELMRRFQFLWVLSGVQVRSEDEIKSLRYIQERAENPLPAEVPKFEDVDNVGATFLRQFYAAYDNDRMSLISTFYDNRSQFSMTVNMNSPHDRNFKILPWGAYTRHSRNLKRYTHLSARMRRKYTGADEIKEVWSSLPVTSHPDIDAESKYFAIESQVVSSLPDLTGQSPCGVNGLMITIQGHFEETDSNTKEKGRRSFARTFTLGPGINQPVRVINDMLTLKAFSVLPKYVVRDANGQIVEQVVQQQGVAQQDVPQPLVPQQVVPPPVAPQQFAPQQVVPQQVVPQQVVPQQMAQQQAAAPQAAVPQIQTQYTKEQEEKITQFIEASGMKLEYSAYCLLQGGWNLETAWDLFVRNRDEHNIPADAWINGVPPQ